MFLRQEVSLNNMKKVIATVVIIVVAALIFLPIYNGPVICGFNPAMGCWNGKVNLIQYLNL
jgi:hypothetical protein